MKIHYTLFQESNGVERLWVCMGLEKYMVASGKTKKRAVSNLKHLLNIQILLNKHISKTPFYGISKTTNYTWSNRKIDGFIEVKV